MRNFLTTAHFATTSKTNCSHQKQIVHIKNKLFTSKTNCLYKKQITMLKNKFLRLTSKAKSIYSRYSTARLMKLSPVFTRSKTRCPICCANCQCLPSGGTADYFCRAQPLPKTSEQIHVCRHYLHFALFPAPVFASLNRHLKKN